MAVADTPSRVPLKLQGEGPWTVSYRNMDTDEVVKKELQGANAHVLVRSKGTYQITGVSDKLCPGDVDAAASTFSVDWFLRPEMSLVETDSIKPGSAGAFTKQDVCEGDVDGFEVNLKGKSRNSDILAEPR